VVVTGSDAVEWLDDLVSAGLSGVEEPRRSLLLTPTGRIRADFHVVPVDEGRLLIQDPVQPVGIDELLDRYVLSSNVRLEPSADPSTGDWRDDAIHIAAGTGHMSLDAFDEWRIHEGIPRFGVDLDEDSLPQEAGWERFIDFTKGCFMGQEAMAKIRNMGGHPTRVVKPVRSEQPITAGEPVFADGVEAGTVTSAAGTDLIVRIRWDSRNEKLATAGGAALSDRA